VTLARVSFDGQCAVVTGAGRGLGRSHAVEFARRGASVVVNDIDLRAAQAVVEEIEAADGRATASSDSVSSPRGGAAIVELAVERYGSLDILVNNAGFMRNGWFEDLRGAEIDEIIEVHLRGAFNVTQPAWRVMKARGYGRIIITTSSSGLFSHQGVANYASAKAGAYGLMRALAYEGVERGIKVNCVLPYAATAIQSGSPIPAYAEHRARYGLTNGGLLDPEREAPELVTHMVVALAARESDVTGEAFSICAGRYGRVFVGVTDGLGGTGSNNCERRGGASTDRSGARRRGVYDPGEQLRRAPDRA
jgi:NAD(P)-dependent dehydrogenase (short-subunit alcohol dehydrogenase family)